MFARESTILLVEVFDAVFYPLDYDRQPSSSLLVWREFSVWDYNLALTYAYAAAHPGAPNPANYDQMARLRLFGQDSGLLTAVVSLEALPDTRLITAVLESEIAALHRVGGYHAN